MQKDIHHNLGKDLSAQYQGKFYYDLNCILYNVEGQRTYS